MTSDELLTAVRDSATLPTWDEGADARLLRLLNREQGLWLTKLLTSCREEYRTTTLDITVVDGQLRYDIPTRAIASGIKMLQSVNNSDIWLLTELRPSDIPWLYQQWVSPARQFYLERNQIVFYSQPPTGTLRVFYPMRLGTLVLVASARTISAKASTTFTLSSTIASGTYDFIDANPQFDTLAQDQAVTVSSTTGTISAGVPSRVVNGCYMAAAGTTPVCQAPLELHSLLALRVAYVTLQAKGDPQAPALLDQLKSSTDAAMALLEPRPSKPRSIINYNGPGWSAGRGYGWRGSGL